MLDPHKIILHPFVTEKTMNLMERENKLEFIVKRSASKPQIKAAFEQLFNVKVKKVNTMILKTGKHAIILLAEGYNAEDVGMRIGIF
jgi:large subunit ribosomal protein L23